VSRSASAIRWRRRSRWRRRARACSEAAVELARTYGYEAAVSDAVSRAFTDGMDPVAMLNTHLARLRAELAAWRAATAGAEARLRADRAQHAALERTLNALAMRAEGARAGALRKLTALSSGDSGPQPMEVYGTLAAGAKLSEQQLLRVVQRVQVERDARQAERPAEREALIEQRDSAACDREGGRRHAGAAMAKRELWATRLSLLRTSSCSRYESCSARSRLREGKSGGSCRIRTYDLRIKSPLLYQLS
jgi:hypothetical protein